MSSIRLERISKHWGATRAVDDVSFEAAEGTFVVLLGPSGCGKSTTLRLIAGLDTPASGTLHIAGKDVTGLPPAQRGVSMVFQSYALFPHLSVAENIVFGLRVRKVPDRDAKLKRVAGMLGLEPLLARKPSQLSGGQQQRVALGRAIIAETPVCLMDEPLSNLDAQLRGEMRREIRSLQRRLGITMVYVTHDQTEAMTMADQVVLMRAGRVEQAGTPGELYGKPATAFTAGFIGAPPMNIIERSGEMIGVRAENVRLEARGTKRENGIDAIVDSVEYLGADSLVYVTPQDSRASCLVPRALIARVPGRATSTSGEHVALSWDPHDEHHFDPTTGGRKT